MTDSLKKHLGRIDIRRLSGMRSVLGIALESGGAHVVELRRRGNPLDSLAGKIEAVKSFTCSLKGQSTEESGIALRSALSDFGIRTKYAVISLAGARYVSTIIPPEIDNVHDWVEENTPKLLHLPVAQSEIVFHVDITESTPSGQRARVTFVRKGEVESCVGLAASAGLELLAITPGLQDLIPVCTLSQTESLPQTYRIVHYEQGTLTTLSCENGQVRDVKTEHTSSGLSLPEVIERTSSNQVGAALKVFVSGAFEKPGDVLIRPFGLTSDFALAAGLALRAMLPASRSVDFLPQREREVLELGLAKRLLQRTILASGLLLLFVLGVPLALSGYLVTKLDDSNSDTANSAAEIGKLENEVSVLKESSRACDAPGSRSNSAFILHEIARLTPKTVRLLSLALDADGPGFYIKGEATSEAAVSEFMKHLKGSPLSRDISLKKLDSAGRASGNFHAIHGRVYFELAAQILPGKGI